MVTLSWLTNWSMHRMRPHKMIQLLVAPVGNTGPMLAGKGSRRDTTICACSKVYIALDTSPQMPEFPNRSDMVRQYRVRRYKCRESSGNKGRARSWTTSKVRNSPMTMTYDIPWLNRDVIQLRILQYFFHGSSSFVRATPRQCQGRWEEVACNLGTGDVESQLATNSC